MSNDHVAVQRQCFVCPTCDKKGKPVKTVTLRALLKPDLVEVIIEGLYLFCDSLDCDTVYYAEDGSHTFLKSDMTVRVGVKETDAPRHVFYCFDHTVEEIEDEVRRTGSSTVLDDIKTRMKSGCWCEMKSPQGGCCLGTVSKYVKQAMAQHGNGDAQSQEEDHREDCCGSGAHAVSSNQGGSTSTGKAEKLAQVGAVLSAIAASACCWLPLLLVALGASGVAVSATLEQYRPIFLTVTFALLGAAFYFTYRPKRVPEGEACYTPSSNRDVTDAGCCPPGENKALNLRKLNKVVLWIVAAAVLAFAFFPNYVGLVIGGSSTPPDAQLAANVTEVSIAIEGMTCEACANRLRSNLESLSYVKSAAVSYTNKSATVFVDKDGADKEALGKAVEIAGYKATSIEYIE